MNYIRRILVVNWEGLPEKLEAVLCNEGVDNIGLLQGQAYGTKHSWCHVLPSSNYQYCSYVWANEFDVAQQEGFKYK